MFKNLFSLLNTKKGVWVIIGTIILLRTWKVAELFNFTFSEEHQAFLAWEQIKNFHPIWIGVSAANIYYYLGPGFTYINALLFKISNGDPASLAWFASLLGLATTASIYYVARTFFSNQIGLYAAIIYGCSTLINLNDRRFWNPTPIPFITIWMVFSLIKAKKNPNWLILTAGLIGAAFHTHLTMVLFMVPTLYVVYVSFKKQTLKTNMKAALLACIVYLIVTSPLIVFDVVHNFDNLMMPMRTITGKQRAALDTINMPNMASHLGEISSSFGRLWYIKLYSNPQDEVVLESHNDQTRGNIMLASITFLVLFYFLIKNKNEGYEIFSISIITILFAFILYPSYNPEYYLMSILTLMAIAIAYGMNSMPQKLSNSILALFIIANIATTMTLSDKYGLLTRAQLVKKTMQGIGNKSYELETIGELPKPAFTYAGWRYIFKYYGATPAKSNVDPVLGWIYPDEISKEVPELKVIVADTIEPKFDQEPIATFSNGPYRSYVFNSAIKSPMRKLVGSFINN